ncbi:MFS transporter [Aliigemmobacter aestuarii]|uniref:MFS transporter n=1 Tax=Aliigemmobacter aestuarii TaxID=1445661 RepID=UPI001454C19D|nr:MFS transporter [Gemmobacter aestuarii]
MTVDPPGDGLSVWLLAFGQTLTYAGLYYGFAALLPALEADFGWTKAELAAGPTLAFLVTAVLTPFTGGLVDRGRAGEMLTLLPLLGGAAMAGMALAQTQAQWLALWALVGVAQAGAMYETCFAFLTRRLGQGARAAITRVTLVAGFAGTLAFPFGAALAAVVGGRGGLVGFAVLVALGVAPVNLWAVVRLRRRSPAARRRADPEPGAMAAALRRPAFWGLAAVWGLIWLNHTILITYALELFTSRGAASGVAVVAASCIGPAQVSGRLLLMLNEARVGNARATMFALVSILVASVCLAAAGVALPLIFAFALCQGMGAGLLSILKPVLTADLLGRRGFGAVSGALAVAPILSSAAGPSVGAALLAAGGTAAVLSASFAMAVAGTAIAAVLLARGQRDLA